MPGRVNLAILKIERSRRGALCPDFMILDSIIRKADRDRMKSMTGSAERIHGHYGNGLEDQGGAYREGHGGPYSLKNSEAYQNIGRLEEIPQLRALKMKRLEACHEDPGLVQPFCHLSKDQDDAGYRY